MKLFLSKVVYDGHKNESDYIGQLIKCRSVTVFLNMTNEEIYKEYDNYNCSIPIGGHNRGANSIKSGKVVFDLVNNYKTVRYGLSKAIFITDDVTFSKEKREKIQNKYGILCIGEKDNDLLKLICTNEDGINSQTVTKGDDATTYGDWDYFFNGFDKIPCSALVFMDHYLKNDKHDFCNFKKVLSGFLSCPNINSNFYLLIICGDKDGTNRNYFHNEMSGVINKVIAQIIPDTRQVCVEYIYCKSSPISELYEDTHDRNIFSNYIKLSCTKGVDVFKYKNGFRKSISVKYTQDISCKTSFSEFLNSQKNDTPEESVEKYLETIKKDFHNIVRWTEDKNAPNTYHCFDINGNVIRENNNINLKNRIIMEKIEINDGSRCWYISVSNDNDWCNLECKDDIFIYEHYKQYIVVDHGHKEELKKIISKIKDLFENHTFNIATENDLIHYRVSVKYASHIKTVHVKSSSDKNELLCQMRDYPRNLFKNRDDAIKMADKIAEICGFKRTTEDE